jgi:hypothetical protein
MINVGCGSCGARSGLSPSPAAPTTTGAPSTNLQTLTDTTCRPRWAAACARPVGGRRGGGFESLSWQDCRPGLAAV